GTGPLIAPGRGSRGNCLMKPPQRRYPLESWVLLYPPEAPPPTVAAAPRPPVPWTTWGAWGLIGLMVVGTVGLQGVRGRREEGEPRANEPPSVLKEVQARTVLGVQELFPEEGEKALASLKSLKAGPPIDQLSYVIYAGELVGPKRALQELA